MATPEHVRGWVALLATEYGSHVAEKCSGPLMDMLIEDLAGYTDEDLMQAFRVMRRTLPGIPASHSVLATVLPILEPIRSRRMDLEATQAATRYLRLGEHVSEERQAATRELLRRTAETLRLKARR